MICIPNWCAILIDIATRTTNLQPHDYVFPVQRWAGGNFLGWTVEAHPTGETPYQLSFLGTEEKARDHATLLTNSAAARAMHDPVVK